MISYQVIRQEKTELHLNSDYLRMVFPGYPGATPKVKVTGFVTGGDFPVPLTAINEFDFSTVQNEISTSGNYLFSIAGFPIIQIKVSFGENGITTRNSAPEGYYDIKVSWEEK